MRPPRGTVARRRKTVIVICSASSRKAARNAWDAGEPFQLMTSEGPGRAISKSSATQYGISDVLIRFEHGSIEVHIG